MKITKEEMKMIENAVKIYNKKNPNDTIRLEVERKPKKTILRCLMFVLGFTLMSCELPQELDNKVLEEKEVEMSEHFESTMLFEYQFDKHIFIRNINEPYDVIEMIASMNNFYSVGITIEDDYCELKGELADNGNVLFDLGDCRNTEFHFTDIFNFTGVMYNDTYYEVIGEDNPPG